MLFRRTETRVPLFFVLYIDVVARREFVLSDEAISNLTRGLLRAKNKDALAMTYLKRKQGEKKCLHFI
jgi:hypothetical protein